MELESIEPNISIISKPVLSVSFLQHLIQYILVILF
jgi:hypothetical protein